MRYASNPWSSRSGQCCITDETAAMPSQIFFSFAASNSLFKFSQVPLQHSYQTRNWRASKILCSSSGRVTRARWIFYTLTPATPHPILCMWLSADCFPLCSTLSSFDKPPRTPGPRQSSRLSRKGLRMMQQRCITPFLGLRDWYAIVRCSNAGHDSTTSTKAPSVWRVMKNHSPHTPVWHHGMC